MRFFGQEFMKKVQLLLLCCLVSVEMSASSYKIVKKGKYKYVTREKLHTKPTLLEQSIVSMKYRIIQDISLLEYPLKNDGYSPFGSIIESIEKGNNHINDYVDAFDYDILYEIDSVTKKSLLVLAQEAENHDAAEAIEHHLYQHQQKVALFSLLTVQDKK